MDKNIWVVYMGVGTSIIKALIKYYYFKSNFSKVLIKQIRNNYQCCQHTVWKFHDFSITQVLHEINFGESSRAKTAILSHLEALNLDLS